MKFRKLYFPYFCQSSLLLANIGYAPLNTDGWVSCWQPHVFLLGVVADGCQGCPDPETQQTVHVHGYSPLRTEWDGWIGPEWRTTMDRGWKAVIPI